MTAEQELALIRGKLRALRDMLADPGAEETSSHQDSMKAQQPPPWKDEQGFARLIIDPPKPKPGLQIVRCPDCGVACHAKPGGFFECPKCGAVRDSEQPDLWYKAGDREKAAALLEKSTQIFQGLQVQLDKEAKLGIFSWNGQSVEPINWNLDQEVWQREMDEHWRITFLALNDIAKELARLNEIIGRL